MLEQFLESAGTSANVALGAIEYFAILAIVLCAGRMFYRLLLKSKGVDLDLELTGSPSQPRNMAMAIAMSGYLAGLGIAATGGMYATGGSATKMAMVALVGALSIVLVKASLLANDYLILDKFRNIDEITKDHNVGVAWIEAGSCVASGCMIYGVVSGQSSSLGQKLMDGLIYWVIGQVLLVIGARVYFKTIHYNVEEKLQDGNAPVGVAMGGFLCALGIVLEASFMGATSNVAAELGTILVFFAMGLGLLLASRVITDRVLMPSTTLRTEVCENQSMGAGVIAAVAFVTIAILFSGSVSPANSYALSHPTTDASIDADDSAETSAITSNGNLAKAEK